MMSELTQMLRLPSNPTNLSKIELLVSQMAEKFGFTSDLRCNILISLTEAVTNAIVHGNKGDEKKMVRVACSVEHNRRVSFRVSDEGKGFNPKQVPDPTRPENICKCGGRGVFLMRQLSHRVIFLNNGSTVEMQFKV
jgi:serine/threonine-protein kinase RsbW